MVPWPHVAEVAALVFAAYLIGCTAGLLLRLALSQGEEDRATEPRRNPSPSEHFAAIAGLKPTPAQRVAANIASSSKRPLASAKPVFTTVEQEDARIQLTPAALKPLVLMAPERAKAEVSPVPPAEIAGAEVARSTARAGFGKPTALPAARGGIKDNLRLIKGIGPRVERGLNGLGVFHFDQIASWDRKTVVWVENHFSFKGRVEREKWVGQASELSGGPDRAPRSLRA